MRLTSRPCCLTLPFPAAARPRLPQSRPPQPKTRHPLGPVLKHTSARLEPSQVRPTVLAGRPIISLLAVRPVAPPPHNRRLAGRNVTGRLSGRPASVVALARKVVHRQESRIRPSPKPGLRLAGVHRPPPVAAVLRLPV